MAKFTNPLDNIKIASPCSADWEAMIGNNRQRYCGECKLNVYNLSGMSRSEAENLLIGSEGLVCVRYFRRSDGTILTKDCPVGWQVVKVRMSRFWTATASLLFTIFGGIGITTYFSRSEQNEKLMGKVEVSINSEAENTPVELMGSVIYDYDKYEEGKIPNVDEVKDKIKRK